MTMTDIDLLDSEVLLVGSNDEDLTNINEEVQMLF